MEQRRGERIARLRRSLGAAPALLLVVLLAGGLRLGIAELVQPVRLVGDEAYYARTARNLAAGRGHVYVEEESGTRLRSWRPPAQSFLLSLAHDPFAPLAESLAPMARQQVLLGTLWVAVTGALGWVLLDRRTGVLAAALAGLDPALVAQSHYLWSETLFGVLVGAALVGVALARGWPGAAATGLLFGAAALTREVALPVAGVAALWWIGRTPVGGRRAALLRAGLMLAVTALVVLPWSLRNWRVQGRLVPVSTIGWFAAAEGNTLEHPEWWRPRGPRQTAFALAYFELGDELARTDFARAHALEAIRSEQPAWLLRKALRNLALLWSPDSVLLYKLRRGAYGPLEPAALRAVELGSALWYGLVWILAVLGLALARGRAGLALAVLGTVMALHVASNATARFRLPWMPLLIVYASYAALHWRELPAALAGRRGLGAALAVLFFLGVCVPYYLLTGGRS